MENQTLGLNIRKSNQHRKGKPARNEIGQQSTKTREMEKPEIGQQRTKTREEHTNNNNNKVDQKRPNRKSEQTIAKYLTTVKTCWQLIWPGSSSLRTCWRKQRKIRRYAGRHSGDGMPRADLAEFAGRKCSKFKPRRS